MERTARRTRRLAITLGLNVALAAMQVVGGLVAHSTGLLSDAGHNVTDVVGIAGALLAVRLTLRPRSPAHSFGYHRGQVLAALSNAAVIAAVTVAIVAGSVLRLVHPHAVHGALVATLAGVAFVTNGVAALALRDEASDLNMRSAALHMTGDALGSLAVLVAGVVLVAAPSAEWVDPAAALLVAAIILVEAQRLVRASVDVLLEASPRDLDLADLTEAMRRVSGVGEVHDLHVWSLSSDVRALSAHLVLTGHPTLEQAQAVGDRVKDAIGVPFAIAHSTLELECERCTDDEDDPCLMDGVSDGDPLSRAVRPEAPRPAPSGQSVAG
ncbi:MAG TPA: cation diffusion facilitator family transporter [Acidimicrobiales bacterium]|nr:cation diffusion facilitator family transporter [Acidimicrobiales bacterium]